MERALLALGISLMIGIVILGQEFRDSLGSAVGFIMDPLVNLLGANNFHIVLFIMAAITALYATLIQKYTMDWELMRNVQEKMRVFQKEFREAQLSNNTSLMKKMEGQRAEMMTEQLEMSKQQFKPMAYISIISLPLFMWAYFYIKSHEAAFMVFPFWGEHLLTDTILGPFQYWIFWYFIASLAVSQLMRKALDVGGI
ncbi:membrane protein [Methanolobus chelungpuianus]|uniref:Membrane protein n=2 Tax=Methanolobus chelungpuianus TaxID=502115 RepID=A0AAE3H9S7_9EURY|nr:membrane protein [Methanolobus chelungpuianus]